MSKLDETPRIYVVSLSDYNAGRNHGVWINLDKDLDIIEAEIEDMLKESVDQPTEEWAIHDYEGFQGFNLGQNPDLEEVKAFADALMEHGEAFAAYTRHVGMHYANADTFKSNFLGKYDNPGDWAEQWLEDTGMFHHVSADLRHYFDFEKYAMDCKRNGDIFSEECSTGGVYLFINS